MHNNMNVKHIRNIFTAAALSIFILGCEKQAAPKNENVSLTVRVSEVSFDYARVTIKHDGPEELTWYGFLTTDVERNASLVFYEKYIELMNQGNIQQQLRRETERNILLEDLEEETKYRYIAFGITDDGKLYDNVGMGYIDFKT